MYVLEYKFYISKYMFLDYKCYILEYTF